MMILLHLYEICKDVLIHYGAGQREFICGRAWEGLRSGHLSDRSFA